jgi:hypothetical protein
MLAALLLASCSTRKLARRLPGTWYIEHYDEYSSAADANTGHELDGPGFVSLYKDGRMGRRLRTGRQHGTLSAFNDYRWQLKDSLISITNAEGRLLEEWLITKDLTDYMEWVSVNTARDSVRTMYLKK